MAFNRRWVSGQSALRALLPSWRFFDEPGPALFLELRVDDGDWLPVRAETPHALWVNPAGNVALFEHGTIERLLQELEEPDASPERSVSYLLLKHAVEARLPAPTRRYQFRIRERDQAQAWLTSAVHEVAR